MGPFKFISQSLYFLKEGTCIVYVCLTYLLFLFSQDLDDAAQKAVKITQIMNMAEAGGLKVSFELPIWATTEILYFPLPWSSPATGFE